MNCCPLWDPFLVQVVEWKEGEWRGCESQAVGLGMLPEDSGAMLSGDGTAMPSEHGPAKLCEDGPAMPSECGVAMLSEYGPGVLFEDGGEILL